MDFNQMFEQLEAKIQQSYTEGVTMVEAERLAGEFLHCQMLASAELRKRDLNARMHKSGLKAVRSAVYVDAARPDSAGKRPTEAAISAVVDTHEVVQNEQNDLDKSESERDELERQYDIAIQGHIHFRTIAKGGFS